MPRKLHIFLASAAALLLAPAAGGLDLTLERAKILALENNRDVRIEMRNVDAARGDLQEKKGAFDPVLGFSSSYRDAKIPTNNTLIEDGIERRKVFSFGSELSGRLPTGTSYRLYDLDARRTETDSPLESLSPSWNASLGFSVGQELLRDFLQDSDGVSVAVSRRDRNMSAHEFSRVVSRTLHEVERDYWNVAAARRDLELERKALELARDLERRTRTQVEVGVLPRVALTQAMSETAARRVTLISTENAHERAKDALKNRLALPLGEEIKTADVVASPYVEVLESLALEQALEKRPELSRAREEIERNDALKRFRSRQRLPRLSVEGRLDYVGVGGEENPGRIVFGQQDVSAARPLPFNDPSDAFDNLFDRRFPDWRVTGTFSFPLFNRAARGAYARARAELDRSMVNYEKRKDAVRLEVRDAVRNVRDGRKRIEAASLSVKLAREVLGNEEEKLKAGLSTTREVLEAQRDLIRAEAGEIRAVVDYNVALSELERAKGTILESNSVVIEGSEAEAYLEVE